MNNTTLGLALFLQIFMLTSLSSQTINDNRYCMDEYQFCVEFPSYIFTFHNDLIQGNDILLESKDGFSQMTISVSPQPDGASTKNIFKASAKNKSLLAGKEPKIVSSLFGEDFYECFFIVGLDYFYHQSFHFEDYFVRIEINTPINMPDKMQVIRQQVEVEFGETNPGLKATTSIEKGRLDKD